MKPKSDPDNNLLHDAFLKSLARRVRHDTSSTIVLPTGKADTAEVARVLRALESCRTSHK
jgi:hypothetical protein